MVVNQLVTADRCRYTERNVGECMLVADEFQTILQSVHSAVERDVTASGRLLHLSKKQGKGRIGRYQVSIAYHSEEPRRMK